MDLYQEATPRPRVIAYPLPSTADGAQLDVPAHGIARGVGAPPGGGGRNGKADRAMPSTVVDLLTASAVRARVIVIEGSDPIVPTLAEYLRRRYPGIDLIWHTSSTDLALTTVA